MRRSSYIFMAALLAVILCGSFGYAQVTTANILGTVTDTSGAVVPNAKVTITNTGTQLVRTLDTGASGDYAFNLVEPGRYSLRIEVRGFKTFVATGVAVGAGERMRVDAAMQVGESAESIQVVGDSPALQTDSSTVQDVVNEKTVQDLPLNNRNLTGLIQLSAGVTPGDPNALSSGNRAFDRRPTATFSANGQSDQLNNQIVDGMDNNERVQGLNGIRPSVDAIAEVHVQTNNYSAEFGRSSGAVVNVITKSGTNDFHGSVFEYFRNDRLDARDFFSISKSEYRQNQFGGSLGGRIIRNKTFFFADVEESRNVTGSTQTYTVPTLYEEQNPGDFSDIKGPVVPASRINPVALTLFKFYPAPNKAGSAANFVANLKRTQYSTAMDAKVDHHFNDANTVFVKYSFSPYTTYLPGGYPTVDFNGTKIDPSPDYSLGQSKTTSQGAYLNYVHTFRPELLLELKGGFTRINIQSTPLNFGTNASQKVGILNSNIGWDSSNLASMGISGYSGIGGGLYLPIIDANNTFQYSGTLAWFKGSHNIRAGASLIRRQLNYFQDSLAPQGGFGFLGFGAYSNAMANFLIGSATYSVRGNLLAFQGFRSWEPNFFVQDDWRVTRWLTLNLGVRYEVYPPFVEVNDVYSNFDMASLQIKLAGQGTSRALGVNTDYKDISPRLGFAATLPRGMVLRGGYGISYYPGDSFNSIQNLNPPYGYSCVPCFGTAFPNLPLPTSSSISTPSGGVTVKPPDQKSWRIHQFNVALQKQFGGTVFTLAGVGQLGRDMVFAKDLDRPAPPGAGNPALPYIYAAQLPKVSAITVFNNEGVTNYYAMQTSVARRYSKGLMVNGNYTWAHGLGNSSTTTALVTNNPRLEYGNTAIDIRHRISAMLNYDIPVSSNISGAAAYILKGWHTNAIAYWQTGMPFTVTNSVANQNVPGVTSDRPDQVATWAASSPSLNMWFNTTAFAPQVKGTAGNEAPNMLRGPHQRSLNLSLVRDFALRESVRLQFRIEGFNVTNTANFALPDSTIGDGTYGAITSTATNASPRQFQLALKLLF